VTSSSTWPFDSP